MSKSLKLSLINACYCLEILYSDQGKMAETEAMYNTCGVLAGKEKAWGRGDQTIQPTLGTVNNLGKLYIFISRQDGRG